MKTRSNKDFYSILGVDSTASASELRDAYISRTKVIHPDRFDPKTQPNEWKKANEMLSELNEAYSALRDRLSKPQYDRPQPAKKKSENTGASNHSHSSSTTHDSKINEIRAGTAHYVDLPEIIREKLLKRRRETGQRQFKIAQGTIYPNWIYVTILLCWFLYLFGTVDEKRWTVEGNIWHAGLTCCVALLLSLNFTTLMKNKKATLKRFFYLTPLYFIKTEFDYVRFIPIWALQDLAITHNLRNGSYQDSTVLLKFKSHNEELTLSSTKMVEQFINTLREFDSQSRHELARNNIEFIDLYDDFRGLRDTSFSRSKIIGRKHLIGIFVTTFAFSLACLAAAIFINIDYTIPTVASNNPQQRTNIVSTGHENSSHYNSKPLPEFSLPILPLPPSGEIVKYVYDESIAPLEIRAATGSNYLVKLVGLYNKTVLTVFVRGGNTVNIDVPLGTYQIRYAAGEDWYGYEHRFGPNTVYSTAERIFDFSVVGDEVTGYTITLYPVRNGNLTTKRIAPEEF